MITFSSRGDFRRTENFLKKMKKGDIFKVLDQYGREGVRALAAATPVETGESANSWYYEVRKERGSYSIIWSNSHKAGRTPLVIMLQYGHGTGTGGYVQGRDFINPAIKPIFDKIAEGVWREVKGA